MKKETKETLEFSKEEQETMFDICARKVSLTHPVTGEVSILGDNWKEFRDSLEDGWEKDWFDRQVMQIMANTLDDALRDSLEKND